jgi:hypothetical protein
MPLLSKSFTLEEFLKSQEETRLGIDNTPNEEKIFNLQLLCNNVIQPIRDYFNKPVVISSGYRSAALCEAIGSSAKSQHTKGQAADFEIFGIHNKEVSDFIVGSLDWDQCILEFGTDDNPAWIHISYCEGKNRMQVLRAYKSGKKTLYKNWHL